MIGEECDTNRFVPLLHLLQDAGNDTLVDGFHTGLLQLGLAIVSGFVGGLDVEEDEILLLELFDGSIGLPFVVGVPQSCCARHDHLIEAAIDTDAEDEVNGRNDSARVDTRREEVLERLHLRAIAKAPGPDAVGGVLAFGLSLQVDGMVGQYALAPENELAQQVGSLLGRKFGDGLVETEDIVLIFGQFGLPGLANAVVRRGAVDVLVASLDLQEMAIGDTREEPDVAGVHHTSAVERERRQLFVQCPDQFIGLLGRDVAGRMVLDVVAVQADDVAAHGHLAVFDRYLHGGGFERATSFEYLRHIVAEQSQMSNLRTRLIAFGHGDEPAADALECQTIDMRLAGSLQGCLVTQQLDGLVGGSVGQNNQILHNNIP